MIVITFKEALEARQQRTHLKDTTHPGLRELWGLAQASDDDPIFTHLALCADCRKRLGSVDSVRPLAAAADTGLPRIVTWTTADKKYRLTLRRLEHQPLQAILTVQSSLPAGRTLVVEDARGMEILRGEVNSKGQVVRPIADVTTLALETLVVGEAQAS